MSIEKIIVIMARNISCWILISGFHHFLGSFFDRLETATKSNKKLISARPINKRSCGIFDTPSKLNNWSPIGINIRMAIKIKIPELI